MNQLTPSHKKSNQNINHIETPLVINNRDEKIKLQNIEKEKKFKTISHLNQFHNLSNENLNQVSTKLFDEKDIVNLLNNTQTYINDKMNEKVINKVKTNRSPKNRNNAILMERSKNKNINVNNTNNYLSKSSSNIDKLKKKHKNDIKLKNEINNNQKETKNDEDSVNLSALAEDLLSLSEDYNVEIMRKGPINKNDFLGESKEFFNINKNQELNRNLFNLGEIKTMPKLQTKLYSSPLDKLNLKNMNHLITNSNKKKYNYLDNNFYNFQLKGTSNSNTQTPILTNDTYPSKIKTYISSNSIQNITNNNKNVNDINSHYNMKNNTILNNLIMKSHIVKNSNNNNLINNNDMFNKTHQYNKNNFLDINGDILNNLNNNHSVGKRKINLNLNINYNNSNSNRNIKKNIYKNQINSIGAQRSINNKSEFLGKDFSKTNYNNQVQYNKNINFNNININNTNPMNYFDNSNSFQNNNATNKNNNYYSNDNYQYNNKKTFINEQKSKKLQIFNYNVQQNNNLESINKKIDNMNINKNLIINSNTNNINNYNNVEVLSKLQNQMKNYQSNKIFRKNEFHKVSNENVLLDIGILDNDLISSNTIQKKSLGRNSLLMKGKNKNSYKNVYNYINKNKIKKGNNMLYINNQDIITEHNGINNFNSNNYIDGYITGNINTYQGRSDIFDKHN